MALKFTGAGDIIKVRQIKYLKNILEQDHRFITPISRPMLGFKAFNSVAATIKGIEVAHMIHKQQFTNEGRSPFQTFAEPAA